MEMKRKPFQGVLNIILFNWHFHLISAVVLISLLFPVFSGIVSGPIKICLFLTAGFILYSVLASLTASYYVYDYSGFYKLNFLDDLNHKKVLNINAGFDEISEIIINKYPETDLSICDFYDPSKHTEVSIKRAQKRYPNHPKTIKVETNYLLFKDHAFDYCLVIFSAHEIRNNSERIGFFKELNRISKSDGKIIIVEHLRDTNNFLAYTIGFFHFLSKKTWIKTFEGANLRINSIERINPFVTIFKLADNGNSY